MTLYQGLYLVLLLGLAILAFLSHRKLRWIETELKKEVFAHSVRFKNEFEIYKYLWLHAAHFARVNKIAWQSPPQNEDPTTRGYILGPVLHELYEVKETLLNNAPFISEEVARSADELIALSTPPGDFIVSGVFNFAAFTSEVDSRLAALKKTIREETTPKKQEK